MKPMHVVQINTELVFTPGRTFLVEVGCRTLKNILNELYIHMKSPVIFSHKKKRAFLMMYTNCDDYKM